MDNFPEFINATDSKTGTTVIDTSAEVQETLDRHDIPFSDMDDGFETRTIGGINDTTPANRSPSKLTEMRSTDDPSISIFELTSHPIRASSKHYVRVTNTKYVWASNEAKAHRITTVEDNSGTHIGEPEELSEENISNLQDRIREFTEEYFEQQRTYNEEVFRNTKPVKYFIRRALRLKI